MDSDVKIIKTSKLRSIYYFCVISCIVSLFIRISGFFSNPNRENLSEEDKAVIEEFVGNDEYVSWTNIGDIKYSPCSNDLTYIIAQYCVAPTIVENILVHKKLLCHYYHPLQLSEFCEKYGYKALCTVLNGTVALLVKKE